jgi:hypothetical protein
MALFLVFVRIWYDFEVIDLYLTRGGHMMIFQAILIILIWAIPIYLFIKTYKKIAKEEQQDAKEVLKSPSFLLIFGGCCIGFQVFITGSISEIKIIQHIGAALVIIGMVTGCMAAFRQRLVIKGLALMIVGQNK